MKRYLIVLFFSTFALACGDDSDDTDKPVPDDAVEDAGSAFAPVTCDPKGEGACQSANDCPTVESGKAREAASDCGISCLDNDAEKEKTCAETCVVKETSLSTGCAECYVAIVACSREHCLAPCLADPESKACFDCQVENDCRSVFDTCSGLPPVKMP
jgi:hypothetical protein